MQRWHGNDAGHGGQYLVSADRPAAVAARNCLTACRAASWCVWEGRVLRWASSTWLNRPASACHSACTASLRACLASAVHHLQHASSTSASPPAIHTPIDAVPQGWLSSRSALVPNTGCPALHMCMLVPVQGLHHIDVPPSPDGRTTLIAVLCRLQHQACHSLLQQRSPRQSQLCNRLHWYFEP